MPAILALFGIWIPVVLTGWINRRILSARIDKVGSETRALLADMREGLALDCRISRDTTRTA
jgi:hypothetical protein